MNGTGIHTACEADDPKVVGIVIKRLCDMLLLIRIGKQSAQPFEDGRTDNFHRLTFWKGTHKNVGHQIAFFLLVILDGLIDKRWVNQRAVSVDPHERFSDFQIPHLTKALGNVIKRPSIASDVFASAEGSDSAVRTASRRCDDNA